MIKIKTDSRKVVDGDTFVALPGISSDGHDYIETAIENGATKIIAQHGEYKVPTVIVPDTRVYLNDLLKQEYGYVINDMKIIGITGTNGKTTSCFLTYQILNKLGIKCAYIGTIGFYLKDKVRNLPNTSVDIADLYGLLVEAYENDYKYVCLEVSSQGLSMDRFKTISFDIAAFTNLTQDHLDYHKTMNNYCLAKQQLFKQLKKDGKAIINADDKYKDYYLLKDNNNITFGLNGDYKIDDLKFTNKYSMLDYSYQNKNYQIKTNLIGEYNIYNLLTAIVICHELGLDLNKINSVLDNLNMPSGRMERIDYNNNLIIVDYAHTPDAISNIIKTIKPICKGNLYVTFGCTGSRDKTKRPIMTNIVLENVTKAIITIDDPHDEDPSDIVKDMLNGITFNNYEVCLDRKKAIHKGINLLKDNDILLILGKGHEEFIIFKDKKIPFNDKKEVLAYIEYKKQSV
jgi:UDP-N-acetylmuramoyl-L-alanyl-D-glutamate--2,6-diaminopimelate ligase